MTAGYLWQSGLGQRKVRLSCPEQPERNLVLMPQRIFEKADVEGRLIEFEPRRPDILEPVHDVDYIEKVRTAHQGGYRYLDAAETEVTHDVFPQALWSASAGVEAVDQVLGGQLPAAFCAVRPPGHHANRYRALGFCVFNNAAVAAAHALKHPHIDRVLIVDWDVHPGNGTQEIFYDDPSVYTLSVHQSDLFPEAGDEKLTGRGLGEGFNRNVQVKPGSTVNDYLEVFDTAVRDTSLQFRPQLLIISAGFDAHRTDPASRLALEADTYGRLTRSVLAATEPHTGGRTVSILEGGYQLANLQSCTSAHYRALCKADP